MKRREILGTGIAAIATAGIAKGIDKRGALPAQSMESPHSLELLALNRMGFGPRPGDIDRVKSLGFAAYVDEQLNPSDRDDHDCQHRLSTATLPQHVWDDEEEAKSRQEQPLTALNQWG